MRKRLLTLCSSFCVLAPMLQAAPPRLVEAAATLGQGVEQATPHASFSGILEFVGKVPSAVQVRVILLEPDIRDAWLKSGRPTASAGPVQQLRPEGTRLHFASQWPQGAPQKEGLILGVEVWSGRRRLGRDARNLSVAWLQSRPRPDQNEP